MVRGKDAVSHACSWPGERCRRDPDATLLEERVVLIRDRNFDEAIAKAEEEFGATPNTPHGGNAYAQRVVQSFLHTCDAYELFEPPGLASRSLLTHVGRAEERVGDSE